MGVAFDMDGTLLDTERIARACFVQAVEAVGWHMDEVAYNRCIGYWPANARYHHGRVRHAVSL